MKRQRVVLFQGEERKDEKIDDSVNINLKDIIPGKVYRIGKPSNRYYEYIHPVLEPGNLMVDDFEEFRIIEGALIVVTSILHMNKGNRIAVLRGYHELPFLGRGERIFAHIDKSVEKLELIALDIETQQSIELSTLKNIQ